MDFWSKLIGTYASRNSAQQAPAHDSHARLARFQRTHQQIIDICEAPRTPSGKASTSSHLRKCLVRLSTLLQEELRAAAPHLCLHYASRVQLYALITEAASISRDEPVTQSAIALLATLVDSDEEEFLSSALFAKSLMRLVRRTIDSGDYLAGVDTETAILELLFTIAAKIRLQPDILPVWFQSTARPELDDVFVKEKKSFVGVTQKDDFPLCYMLIDRIHHQGRIGDFARTGLLYIFEATGRSLDLEEWVISSDLPTLMASGLGALYSELSRELSILHPDAVLPPVLAMSDYNTTHARATAESAFAEQHMTHMSTFLSHLAFWQDVLDHCRSADVRQTLLDHFQILFLQQLLYPSILQSSDADAGSSVAVLTYLAAILEALNHPDLVHMMLTYLLAVPEASGARPGPTIPIRPSMHPRSPSTLKRRQSLMLLTSLRSSDETMEPDLFSLIDLVINSVTSSNSQTVYASLKLLSTMIARQKSFVLGGLLKVDLLQADALLRTAGALEVEVDMYTELAAVVHNHNGLDETYGSLADDILHTIETQILPGAPVRTHATQPAGSCANCLAIRPDDALLRCMMTKLRTFFTNSIEVNLALTQALIALACCVDVRLDKWIGLDPRSYVYDEENETAQCAWRADLSDDEESAYSHVYQAARRPVWPSKEIPLLCASLQALCAELHDMRTSVAGLDQLLAAREQLLQATSARVPLSDLSSSDESRDMSNSPKSVKEQSRDSSSPTNEATNDKPQNVRPGGEETNRLQVTRSIYQPPPPETPSTTDVLMQKLRLPIVSVPQNGISAGIERTASLNHILTNVVVLQEFILEIVAVLQVRAAVLGEQEVRSA